MTMRAIAILGAGNGGLAAAADLTLRGYDVSLYSRSEQTLQPIRERGGIELIEGENRKLARPALVTNKMADVVANANLIMVAAPADRKSTRLNSSHIQKSRMPSSA